MYYITRISGHTHILCIFVTILNIIFIQKKFITVNKMLLYKQNLRLFFTHSVLSIVVIIIIIQVACGWKREENKSKCPTVKEMTNFNILEFLGPWYIVQYYANSEEALAYKCMHAELSLLEDKAVIIMNFTYSFADDPLNEKIIGNITWEIPHYQESPAHWIHAEYPYEGIYNTYVLDTDYKSWALLMHCAEQHKSPRYLSSFIMSRKKTLGPNFISYLRDKLPRYDINIEYMFSIEQKNCKMSDNDASMVLPVSGIKEAYTIRKYLRQSNN